MSDKPDTASPRPTDAPLAVVVLAAGKGTRMRSRWPKALHPLAGRPMILQLLETAGALAPERQVVVLAPDMDELAALVAPRPTVVQDSQLGTGHAVLQAERALAGFAGDVLVLYADTPLIERDTLWHMLAARHGPGDPAMVVLGFRPDDPASYGRLVTGAAGALERIVEARDATPETLSVTLCNSGVMAIDGAVLFELLRRVGTDNAKREYYLTELVALARAEGRAAAVVEAPADELIGIDERADLAAAEAIVQRRLRATAMAAGVTLVDPETVWLSFDTALGRDVKVGPNVVLGPGVSVGEGAEILPFCHLEGVEVAPRARIGPFARLRPGSAVGEGARVGNFVEVKAASIEPGAKVNHLSYIGDARVGAGANIGAGTITCNYDGFAKHRTEIGANAFIGSNTALVAPVKIGEGAIVGAGSTITDDVEADAIAIARGEQRAVPGAAARFRERRRKTGQRG
jgi:bifunctional UDP-N-acetylglucosamine pyrophosphorylase/glucosamine-1-phosphate N-acetyltransferase